MNTQDVASASSEKMYNNFFMIIQLLEFVCNGPSAIRRRGWVRIR